MEGLVVSDLVFAIALQIEQARQIAMHDAGAGGRCDDRLGVIGDAEPARSDHVEIVGAIADGERVSR